ncbi:MAG: heparinase II/III family protein [Bacteroidetes bacterium]|nr:heparinase II/III family protein [Bacteroidota bacterium]
MMKKRNYLPLLLLLTFLIKGKAQDRNYLTKTLETSGFRIQPTRLAEWKKEQKERYLSRIALLPSSTKQALIKKADESLTYEWPALPASSYLEYKRTGNRVNFERKQTQRRDRLSQLVIGELITGDKKYLDPIVNGLWATLEESTWEIPAIIGLQKAGTNLPDPNENIIGLVSAETGLMIAAIEYMLHDQLDSISPLLTKRIRYELHQRILSTYLHRDDLWWMGFKGQSVNNWNAWINANVLQTALLTSTDTLELNHILTKTFKSTDFFINQYPADGGCDEGPAYWSLAGGKLVKLLYLTKRLSSGKLDWTSIPLFHSMGSYIIDTHIDGDYFVNFADAGPRTIPDPVSVYRFGQLFTDDSLQGFAAYLFSLQDSRPPDNSLMGFLETADLYTDLTTHPKNTGQPAYAFLPTLQVYTARSNKLFLAAQGGNNGESHNHNDVGNFILYAEGHPVLVDAGSGIYTALTFSSRRYELWNMQSQWHSCPRINGTMQSDGKPFKATAVTATTTSNKVQIAMNLEKAYPETAYAKQWKRTFLFDQTKNTLTLSDEYTLQKKTGETRIDLLSACLPKEDSKGEIGFYDTNNRKILSLIYPASLLTPQVEEKKMDDEKLIKEWGPQLYRLSFLLNPNASLKGKINLLIK